MKKIIALLLVLALSVILAACATGDEDEIVSTIRPSSIVEPTSTEASSQEIIIDFEEGGYDDGYGFMDEYMGNDEEVVYGDEF